MSHEFSARLVYNDMTSQGSGFLKRLWHSQTTGEGIVTR